MQKYLRAGEIQLTVQERPFLFQCWMQDIDLRANKPWRYSDQSSISCNDESKEETGTHILERKKKTISPRNNKVTYIP